jgi:FkbM family methyltransferase
MFRSGRLGFLIKPFLQVKLGKIILKPMRRLIAYLTKEESVVRTNFGAWLIVPKGKNVYSCIECEPEVTHLIYEVLRPGMTTVDVGAHLGYYTLLFKIKVRESGKVFAFEPDPYYFGLLKRALLANGMDAGIFIYQMAVWDKNGTATFFLDQYGGTSNLFKPTIYGGSITVETITLDTFFEKLGWPNVDLIKIDVEGAELAVLSGMEELNRRNKSLRLIVEFVAKRPSGVQPEEFFNTLQRFGFTKIFAIEKPSLRKPEEILQEAERVRYLNLFCEKV